MTIDWQPIDTCPDERPILAWHPDGHVVKFDQLTTDHLRRHYDYTHWAPCNPPAPDPMTVAAWHPIAMLPDGHEERVLIRYYTSHTQVEMGTSRRYDEMYRREAWMPLAPLLALIDKAES